MASAYVTNFILSFGGVGMSDMYRLNSVGESTPPCWTPVLIVAVSTLHCTTVRTICVSGCILIGIL